MLALFPATPRTGQLSSQISEDVTLQVYNQPMLNQAYDIDLAIQVIRVTVLVHVYVRQLPRILSHMLSEVGGVALT